MRLLCGLVVLMVCGCAGESGYRDRAMTADDPANPDAAAGVMDGGSETLVVREAPATVPAGERGGQGGHHHAH
jgi:hypothetical protein